MTFKDWLNINEGGQGSGTQFSVTGLGAGGQAQAGIGMTKPARPQKTPPSIFSPSDTVPAGFKPTPGAGGSHGTYKPAKPGMMGAGVIPKRTTPFRLQGGTMGGGSPGSRG